jgi:hypothetical protein
MARFTWQMHTSTTGSNLTATATHQADHDMACGNPNTTKRTVQGGDRTGTPVNDEAFWCPSGGGHMMTSIDTGDVAVLSFTPNQTFTTLRKVCFDANRSDTGEGSWFNLIVVPTAAHGSNPDLSYWAGGQGGNKLDATQREVPVGGYVLSFFRGTVLTFRGADGEGNVELGDLWGAMDSNMPPDAGPRYPVCLERLSDATFRVSAYWVSDGRIHSRDFAGTLPLAATVVFQHGSYNPEKHGTPLGLTEHWDNITIVED